MPAEDTLRLEVESRPGMILRPLARGEEAELLRIHATQEVVRWWDVPEEGFPWGDSESTCLRSKSTGRSRA